MKEEKAARPNLADPLAALGQVTGELVHDLANEVQVLQGWAALARGEAVAGKAPVHEVQRVLDISTRLGRMLRDMLETVSGQTVSPELVFDPHLLTEATVNERIREMASLEVQYRCSLPEGTRVAGRASFWSRIVTNLLVNASRYAFLVVRCSLALRVELDGSQMVVLRMEDDGPGVSPEDQSDIFQPFWRGEMGGAGLGLSSVAWAVGELKGRVRYARDSALGGAAFEVCVPAAGPIHAEPSPPHGGFRLEGKALLLVDDDASIRTSLTRLLQRSGASVTALDPIGMADDRLVDTIVASRPDLVLLDVYLGDRGGISLWRRLLRDVPDLASRVAFVTGLAPGDPTWMEAASTGRPVLGKPFDLQELIQALGRLRNGG